MDKTICVNCSHEKEAHTETIYGEPICTVKNQIGLCSCPEYVKYDS